MVVSAEVIDWWALGPTGSSRTKSAEDDTIKLGGSTDPCGGLRRPISRSIFSTSGGGGSHGTSPDVEDENQRKRRHRGLGKAGAGMTSLSDTHPGPFRPGSLRRGLRGFGNDKATGPPVGCGVK